MGIFTHARLTETLTADVPKPYYYYEVGHEVKCYLDGEQVSIKDYQKAVCVEADGKAGWETCTATTFFNAQRQIGLGK